MSQPGAAADSIWSRWLAILFDCLSCTQRFNDHSESQGVERELKISHNQPHLVPPMKLVFYDEMPKTPTIRTSSAYRVCKDLALKASDRASLTIRRKISKQSISAPQPISTEVEITLRRQQFRPLVLSIHLPGNRLSDLPEFQDVDFNDTGEIQIPPKALLRSRSEGVLRQTSKTPDISTLSMFGERRLDYWQQRPSSTTNQRPTTASSGLNCHPVCWTSLPGLPPQTEPVKTLSPMAEEEEPSSSTTETENSMILEFPPIEEEEGEEHRALPSLPPLTIQIPYKKPLPRPDVPTRLNSFNQSRISQWLSRSTSSSTTTKRTSTSLDARRSQFYQCAISPPPPLPQHQYQHSFSHSHSLARRSLSASSIDSPYAESLASMSMTSMTTAPTTAYSVRSRSGTLRSSGKRVTVVEEEEMEKLPDVPDVYYSKAREVHFRKVSMSSQYQGGMGMEMGVAF